MTLLCIQRFVCNNKFLDQVDQINGWEKIGNLEPMAVLVVEVPTKQYIVFIAKKKKKLTITNYQL